MLEDVAEDSLRVMTWVKVREESLQPCGPVIAEGIDIRVRMQDNICPTANYIVEVAKPKI